MLQEEHSAILSPFIKLHITVTVKYNIGYQGWNMQNVCQNSKHGRPDQKQSDLALRH